MDAPSICFFVMLFVGFILTFMNICKIEEIKRLKIENESLLSKCMDAELDLEEARVIIKNYHKIINGENPF